VADALRKFLTEKLGELDQLLGNQSIRIGPPLSTEQDKVSIWIYRVNPNGDLRHHKSEKPSPPLPLDLHALITPNYSSSDKELKVLGGIMQIFYTWPIVNGANQPALGLPDDCELRITQEGLTLEELSQVWHSLNQPFRLSIAYLVSFVTLDSLRAPPDTKPVQSTTLTSGQILDVSRLADSGEV
jgi:hypothetical protein